MTYSVIILSWAVYQNHLYPNPNFDYWAQTQYHVSDHTRHTQIAHDFMNDLDNHFDQYPPIYENQTKAILDSHSIPQVLIDLILSYQIDMSLVQSFTAIHRHMYIITKKELFESPLNNHFSHFYEKFQSTKKESICQRSICQYFQSDPNDQIIEANYEDSSIVWYELAKYCYENPTEQYFIILFD